MEIKNLFDLPEIRGIVESRKLKSYSIKLVLKDIEIAEDFAQDLLEFISENEERVQYLKNMINLKDILVSNTLHNVVINYIFNSVESAKEFEQGFSSILDKKFSNLLTTIFLNDYMFKDRTSYSKLTLNLPIDAGIFTNTAIESVTLNNCSAIITRELGLHNGKEVFIDNEDFSTPFFSIRLSRYGNLITVSKDWIIRESIKLEALIYSSWALTPEFFISFTRDGISCRLNDKVMTISLAVIKEDNLIVEVIPDGEDYRIVSDRLKDEILPKELLLFN